MRQASALLLFATNFATSVKGAPPAASHLCQFGGQVQAVLRRTRVTTPMAPRPASMRPSTPGSGTAETVAFKVKLEGELVP